jgi:hypothetical protein
MPRPELRNAELSGAAGDVSTGRESILVLKIEPAIGRHPDPIFCPAISQTGLLTVA